MLPVTPTVLFDASEHNKRFTPEQSCEMLKEFEQAEATLWRRLREQKLLIHMEGVSLLLARLLEVLEHTLRNQAEGYGARHEALERNRIPDLHSFIAQAKARHADGLRDRTCHLPAKAKMRVRTVRDLNAHSIKSVIDKAASKPALENILKERVPMILRTIPRELRQKLDKVTNMLEEEAYEEYSLFQTHFTKLYRSLATLGGSVSLPAEFDDLTGGTLGGGLTGQLPGLDQLLAKASETHGNLIAGGTAAGVVIGTLLFPGPGTLIGGFLGYLAGDHFDEWFGPSLGDVKTQVKQMVETELQMAFTAIESSAADGIWGAVDLVEHELHQLIDRHGQRYAELVGHMISCDQAEAEELQALSHQTQAALAEIKGRRQQLADARRRLRNL